MSVTLLLIIVIVGVSLYSWQNPAMQQKFIMNPYRIKHRQEYYRFITSGFIHSGYVHLAFNMFTLYFFGAYMEKIFIVMMGTEGAAVYLLLFLLGVIVSDIPTFIKYKELPYYNSLGASGGVSSVLFASILYDPLNPIMLMFIPIPIPGFILGALYLAYSYQQSKQSNDNINHDAHFYGAVFGIVFGIVIEPSIIFHFFQQLSTWSIF